MTNNDNYVGSLTAELMNNNSKSFNADRANQIARRAAMNSGILAAATDPEAKQKLEREFSLELKQGSITNQRSSGRCWMFASLNVLRQDVIKRWKFDDFEFSETYLFFYDKLEKSNYYLEEVLKTLDKPLDDRLFEAINGYPADDGGWWGMFAALATKYGLVPKSAYPENANTMRSSELTLYLNNKLREFAQELRTMYANGASETELRQRKDEQSEDIYRIVAISLGEPPEHFNFIARVKDDTSDEEKSSKEKNADSPKNDAEKTAAEKTADKKSEESDNNGFVSGKIIREENITPLEFYKKYVGQDLSEYYSLVNAPMQNTPFGKLYKLAHVGNVVEAGDMQFINVPMDEMKEAIVKQLQGGKPVWFACDCEQFSLRKAGVFDRATVRVDDLFNVEYKLDKGDRLAYSVSPSNHAMTLIGVHLDENGKPVRWKIENSWGSDAGEKGYYVASDEWLSDYVYETIIHKDYLKAETIAVAESEPVELMPWQPISRATKCR